MFLSFGIYRLKGPISVWYLGRGVYTSAFTNLAIPFGCVMLLWSLGSSPLIPDEWKLDLFIAGAVGGFLSIFLVGFLKPAWLRWLEREHGKILPLLRNEIHEMGYHNWDQRINTQQDLEEWIAEIQCKRGL